VWLDFEFFWLFGAIFFFLVFALGFLENDQDFFGEEELGQLQIRP